MLCIILLKYYPGSLFCFASGSSWSSIDLLALATLLIWIIWFQLHYALWSDWSRSIYVILLNQQSNIWNAQYGLHLWACRHTIHRKILPLIVYLSSPAQTEQLISLMMLLRVDISSDITKSKFEERYWPFCCQYLMAVCLLLRCTLPLLHHKS